MISKKELYERICDLESDVDIQYQMLEDLKKIIKKLEKEKKNGK